MSFKLTTAPSESTIIPPPQRTPICEVPHEITIEFFKHLPLVSIGICRSVCRTWNILLNDDNNWQRIFESLFPHSKFKPFQQFQPTCKKQYCLDSNRPKGVYASKTLEEEENKTLHIKSYGNKIYTSKQWGPISVRDYQSFQVVGTLNAQRKYDFIITDKKIITIDDSSAKCNVWDIDSFTRLVELDQAPNQNGVIISPVAKNGKLYLSADVGDTGYIKIWDLESYECLGSTSLGQNNIVQILDFDPNTRKLFTCFRNGTAIKVWDTTKSKLKEIATLQVGAEDGDGNQWVNSFLISNDKLFSLTRDKTLKIWNTTTHQCESTMETNLAELLTIDDGNLFGHSGRGKNIGIWDISTLKPITTLYGHGDLIESIYITKDGRYITTDNWTQRVEIFDLTADDEVIFSELANELEKFDANDLTSISETSILERFSRMPEYAKQSIYAELYKLIKGRLKEDYEGIAEHAFHDQYGQSSTRPEKVQAIRNYLEAKKTLSHVRVPPKKPLLEFLGIVSDEQYSNILKCRPKVLQDYGILTPDDLKVICSPSHNVKLLATEQEAIDETNFRDSAVKVKADKRRIVLSDFADQISKSVSFNINETNTCGVLLYDGDSPWIGFQNKFNAFHSQFTKLVEACDGSPQLIAEAFTSSKYNALAAELNALAEEFLQLDKEHQIAKLNAYVNQWGILPAWTNLGKQHGIFRLVNLPSEKKSLRQLFQMGE